jgi:hypothetical protein
VLALADGEATRTRPVRNVHLVPHTVDHPLSSTRTRHAKLPAVGIVASEEKSCLVLHDRAQTLGGDAAHNLPCRNGPHVEHAALRLVQRRELGACEVRAMKVGSRPSCTYGCSWLAYH